MGDLNPSSPHKRDQSMSVELQSSWQPQLSKGKIYETTIRPTMFYRNYQQLIKQ